MSLSRWADLVISVGLGMCRESKKFLKDNTWRLHPAWTHHWFPILYMYLSFKKNVNSHYIDWYLDRNLSLKIMLLHCTMCTIFFKLEILYWRKIKISGKTWRTCISLSLSLFAENLIKADCRITEIYNRAGWKVQLLHLVSCCGNSINQYQDFKCVVCCAKINKREGGVLIVLCF